MTRLPRLNRLPDLGPIYAANPRIKGYITLLMLSCAVLISLIAALLLGSAASALFPAGAPAMLATSGVNTALMFGLPGFLVCWWMKMRPSDYLCLRAPAANYGPETDGKRAGGWRWFVRALVLFFVALPLLNQTIWWNENLPVPDSGIWQQLRQWEEAAADATRTMLGGESIGSMIACVLIVGVLTGFCEEVFFRGAVQRTLTMCGMGPQVAIWMTAAIFSLLHFQFFGFVPRLLLGALFGYMLLYSKSVWVPAAMHALNNSAVVVTTRLANRGAADADSFEMFGVAKTGVPLTALASAILIAAIISIWKKKVVEL